MAADPIQMWYIPYPIVMSRIVNGTRIGGILTGPF